MPRHNKTSWKKGQSGNPKGSKGLPKELREARLFNRMEMEHLLNRLMYCTPAQLKELVNNSATPQIEIICASILIFAAKQGDQHRLEWIFTRLLGKPKQEFEFSGQPVALSTTPPQIIVNLPANGREVK